MESFVNVEGVALPLLEDNVDTDAIAPLDVSRHPDYAHVFFRRRREAAQLAGKAFIADRPAFAGARILVVGNNFGCGSSRESAVWSIAAFGIRCVIARSFADAFRLNCLRNGVLPVSLAPEDAAAFEQRVVEATGARSFYADLREQRVGEAGGAGYAFTIDAHERQALLEGLDDIALTLQHLAAIERWEAATRRDRSYLQYLERQHP
jgi:3-isopropylmalate/(R)-2-methylmalate dehydratase small subunit